MAKMRVSMHSGRAGLARHNDRSGAVGDHVDQSKSGGNIYWCVGMAKPVRADQVPAGLIDTTAAELGYYRKRYGAAIKATNDRYRRQSHKEKCKTVEQVYNGAKTKPLETILQIGKTSATVDEKTFRACVFDYLDRLNAWSKERGGHVHVISVQIHVDEQTLHAHVRRVFDYKDADGHYRLSQTKALAAIDELTHEMPLPEPDKAEDRHNNRMMTFTAFERSLWQTVCQEHGVDVNLETVKTTKRRRRTEHRDQLDEEILAKEAELYNLDAAVKAKERLIGTLDDLERENAVLGAKIDDFRRDNGVLREELELVQMVKEIKDSVDWDALAQAAYEADQSVKSRAPLVLDTDKDLQTVRGYNSLVEVANALDDYDHDER